jgi:hypothetical protein
MAKSPPEALTHAAYRMPLRIRLARFRERYFPRKSSHTTWVEKELARIKVDEDDDGIQAMMNKSLLRICREFSRAGHSGTTADYAVKALEKLLRWEPLTPLTGEDSEWNDVSAMHGEPCWQNNRCGRIFKEGDGRAYDIDGRVFVDADGTGYTSRGSRVYVEFPYTPHTEYISVGADGEPLEGPSLEELAKG